MTPDTLDVKCARMNRVHAIYRIDDRFVASEHTDLPLLVPARIMAADWWSPSKNGRLRDQASSLSWREKWTR